MLTPSLLPTPENFHRLEQQVAAIIIEAPSPILIQALGAFCLGKMAGCYVIGAQDALTPSRN